MHDSVFSPEIPTPHPNAQLVEHSNFIPLNSITYIEGPGHRDAIKHMGVAVINDANSRYELAIAESRNLELQGSLHRDALTGIPNNEAFKLALAESIDKADRGEVPQPAVLFIDLDRFKQANDILGHGKVDQMLIDIATEFADSIKLRSDTSPEGKELLEMIARKSGDEFIAYIYPVNYQNDRRDTTLSPEEIIRGFTERIEKLVDNVARAHNAPFVGVSVGHAIHKKGESLVKVIHRADVDMYRVKNLKKGGRIKQMLGRISGKSVR